ncbi:MAG: hypothetical protein PQJ50_01775 [Spirochaetales bacterium]|nr:hypothetical protein [Spirochaetales bacterium]
MWIDNGDGTKTAEDGDTLYEGFGENWQEDSGWDSNRDPKSLQVGEVVGVPINVEKSDENTPSDTNSGSSPTIKDNENEQFFLHPDVLKSWSQKENGDSLTKSESEFQQALGITEMVIGPIGGVAGAQMSGGKSVLMGLYVMADGAELYNKGSEGIKAQPLMMAAQLMIPYINIKRESGKDIPYVSPF